MATTLTSSLQDIAELERTIQLAIAPAFLISALMTALNVMSTRLARLIDRVRALHPNPAERLPIEAERLGRRIHLIYLAITACVVAAILVGILIMGAFVGALMMLPIGQMVGLLLIASMLAMMVGLGCFLAEIWMAAQVELSKQDV